MAFLASMPPKTRTAADCRRREVMTEVAPSRGPQPDPLDLADDDEVGDGRDQRVGADKDQCTVEGAGRGQDVTDHDRGGDAGEVAEGVEQAAGDAPASFGEVSETTAQPSAPMPLPKKATAIRPTTMAWLST